MEILKKLGFEETKPNLWVKEIDNVRLYHDYRKGKRWSYAFEGDNPIDVHELEDYKKVKLFEEASKCKTLDNF